MGSVEGFEFLKKKIVDSLTKIISRLLIPKAVVTRVRDLLLFPHLGSLPSPRTNPKVYCNISALSLYPIPFSPIDSHHTSHTPASHV